MATPALDPVLPGKADFLINDIDYPPDLMTPSTGEFESVADSGGTRARVGLSWLSEDRPDYDTTGLQSSGAADRDHDPCRPWTRVALSTAIRA